MTNAAAAALTAPLLTIDEVADMLHVHASTVRRLIGDGQLPVRRIGRAVRITRAAVDDFIAAA